MLPNLKLLIKIKLEAANFGGTSERWSLSYPAGGCREWARGQGEREKEVKKVKEEKME